jgi:preprotein translocase subunit SecF
MNWMKYRPIYFSVSLVMIAVGIFSLLKWGPPLGIDFKGGSILEYSFEGSFSTEGASRAAEGLGIEVQSIQSVGEKNYLFRLGQVSTEQRDGLRAELEKLSGGTVSEEQFESVGPSIGPELVRKTLYAILISAGAILLWVAFQFKSVKFGVCAILAMAHDSFILVGSFALLGHFLDAEVDFLFVTALLTTLSFSVHDTIVVYDRIREIRRKRGGKVSEVANMALSETMRRSINNSVTIALMLVALVVLGGTTVRWFAVALLIGTVLGTYSSPFVAVPLLVSWEEIGRKFGKGKRASC